MSGVLPLPPFFDSERVSGVWRVPYGERAADARAWAQRHDIAPAATDALRVALLAVDVQNTFCIPGFELFVGGRSGTGAVDDNVRLCRFIYRRLGMITRIFATLDTHTGAQIFHPLFWVNARGEHPAPYTVISQADVEQGVWLPDPVVAGVVAQGDHDYLVRFARHYVRRLSEGGKYDLTIWPYHALLGGIGQALVSSVEEALWFHAVCRCAPSEIEVKGRHPLTEHYSVLRPEVLEDPSGEAIAHKNTRLVETLLGFDMLIVAGQAKSHCVAWTVADVLDEIVAVDRRLAGKVYLLEDCTSPVVVPGVVDYTAAADAAFERFRQAGMHVVKSTDPIERWD